jgi:signal transduction histidine kinase
LSIAARLVARLGGSIAAGNVPGGGAVFAVSLPAG